MQQILTVLDTQSAYFWATHGGAELDLMVTIGGKRLGFEFKHGDSPGTTRSMRTAISDLRLEHLWVVYPGEEKYALDVNITAMPLQQVPGLVAALKTGTGG